MITPRNATEASEIVVVQVRTGTEVPGPPIVASLDPPRLLLSALTRESVEKAALQETVATNVGRLAAGRWQVFAYGVDWTGTKTTPDLGAIAGPASFHVSRGEVFPLRIHPIAGQRFDLRVIGPWSASCSLAVEQMTFQVQPPKIVLETRSGAGCGSTGERVRTIQLDVPMNPLPAGRYDVEVHAQSAEGPVEVYATSSLRVVDLGEPRILALELEEDLDRDSHRLAVEVEIPTVASGEGCTSWEVRPVHAWAHGRDLYAELEVEQVDAACGGAVIQGFRLPLPELETGLYRILAQRSEAGGGAPSSATEPWAQSPRLVEARRLAQRVAGRYQVTLDWRDSTGRGGRATPVARGSQSDGSRPDSGAGQSAIFSFFDDDNWEVLVKVLDGCAINHHHWVFASASTDLEYVLTIEDTETGASVSYRNELGQASPAITDTTALATCE